jgi:hypothetical protein
MAPIKASKVRNRVIILVVAQTDIKRCVCDLMPSPESFIEHCVNLTSKR